MVTKRKAPEDILDRGRPREWDRDQIAKDLIEWSQLDTSSNLLEFCVLKLLPAEKISLWSRECPNFRQAVHLAKHSIGVKREKMLSRGLLHQKAYDLNAPVYDYFLREEKRDNLKYESDLRRKELEEESEQLKTATVKLDEMMSLLSEHQSSALKSADTSIKAETKS